MVGQSLLLSEIARSTSSATEEFKATYKRLQRNIQKYSLNRISRRLEQQNIARLSDKHIIAVDLGDIAKPCARTMEGLGKVADGSKKHQVVNGFWLIGAIAVDPTSEEKTPLPIHLSLYSASEPDFVSENRTVNNLCTYLGEECEKRSIRPTIVIDRGGDRPAILKNLFGLPLFSIVRLNTRHLEDAVTGEKVPIPMLPDDAGAIMKNKGTLTRVSKTGKRVPMNISFGSISVFLPKQICSHLLTVIVCKIEGHEKPIYLITNRSARSVDEMIGIITSYLSRWSIEETYKFMKQSEGLEEVRTQFLNSTKQLIKASFIAACFLWTCAMNAELKEQINEKSFRLKRAPSVMYNWMFRVADGVARALGKEMAEFVRLRTLLEQKRTRRRMDNLAPKPENGP